MGQFGGEAAKRVKSHFFYGKSKGRWEGVRE